jgi:hypothetical protein
MFGENEGRGGRLYLPEFLACFRNECPTDEDLEEPPVAVCIKLTALPSNSEKASRDADGIVHFHRRDHAFAAVAPRSTTGALPEAIGGSGTDGEAFRMSQCERISENICSL